MLQLSPFLDKKGLFRAKNRIGRNQLDFNEKHTKTATFENNAKNLFLRKEHKINQHEGSEQARNVVQQKNGY